MDDLHTRCGAAMDREQVAIENCACDQFWHKHAPMQRRVEADRRVLARHPEWKLAEPGCRTCLCDWPCPELLDLAARYDVSVDVPSTKTDDSVVSWLVHLDGQREPIYHSQVEYKSDGSMWYKVNQPTRHDVRSHRE